MKKLILFAVMIMLVVAISAQPMMGRGQNGPGNIPGDMMGPEGGERGLGMPMDDELLEKVGLKSDQIMKMKIAKMDIEKDLIQLKANLKVKGVDVAEEMMKDNPDENTLKKLSADIGKLRGEIAFKQMQRRLVINKYLTKKQITKLKELRRAHLREMGKRMLKRRIEIRKNIQRR